jgi:hypothetical protein
MYSAGYASANANGFLEQSAWNGDDSDVPVVMFSQFVDGLYTGKYFATNNIGLNLTLDGTFMAGGFTREEEDPGAAYYNASVYMDGALIWSKSDSLLTGGTKNIDLYNEIIDLSSYMGGTTVSSPAVLNIVLQSELAGMDGRWSQVDYIFADFCYVEIDAPVPEPATILLLGSCLAGMGVWRRKRGGG